MNKQTRTQRILKDRIIAAEQEFLLSWKPRGDNNDFFSIWCSSDSLARMLVQIAEEHGVKYTIFPGGIAMELPLKLLPFQLPFSRAYVISEKEKKRRSERFRKIMHLGWQARRREKNRAHRKDL